MWDNLVALATVNVSLRERKGYVPPESPSFGKSIARTFSGSLDMLSAFGQTIVLVGVALAPWLPVIAIVAIGGWLFFRRQRRRPVAVAEREPPSAPAG
jgi:hypothetical protein